MSVKQQKFQNDQSVSDWTNNKNYSTLIIKSCNLNHGSFHLIQSPPPCWASSWPQIFLSSFSPSITDSWAVSFDESCAFSFLSKSSCRLRRWSCCTSASSECRRLCQVNKQHHAKWHPCGWKALESIHFASKVSRKCFWENVISGPEYI